MFSLKVTDAEVDKTLYCLQNSPLFPLTRYDLSQIVYGNIGEISVRKVRLCIIELRKKGHLIVGDKGYFLAGSDPEPVIHFVNGLYSRANKLKSEADNMYWLIKQKYGNRACEQIQVTPGQTPLIIKKDGRTITMLDIQDDENEI